MTNTLAGSRRITIMLPECLNHIIRHSYLIGLSDFKTFIMFNIVNFFDLFVKLKLKLKSQFASFQENSDIEEDEKET